MKLRIFNFADYTSNKFPNSTQSICMNILIFTGSDSSFNSLRPEAEMFINFFKRGHNVTIVTQVDSEYGRIYKDLGIRLIDSQPKKKIQLGCHQKSKK